MKTEQELVATKQLQVSDPCEISSFKELYGVLLKLKECQDVFTKHYENAFNKTGLEYTGILDDFYIGMFDVMKATKELLGEVSLNEVYDKN